MTPKELIQHSKNFSRTKTMPVLFVGHGNPLNAIQDSVFSRAWHAQGKLLPKPSAVLCVSAHWFVHGTYIHGSKKPRTIYDFYGFPPELYQVRYDCPGSPEYAKEAQGLVKKAKVLWDTEWGLDHGTWVIMKHMFPRADVPVFQMSVDYTKPSEFHYALAKELAPLREKGVLIIASGNIVHNLDMFKFDQNAKPFDWAIEFDEKVKSLILAGDHRALIDYEKLGIAARFSIPTPDHYWPLLYALALQKKNEVPRFFIEGIAHASASMRALIIK